MVPDGWKRLFEDVYSVYNLPVSSLLCALVVDCSCLLLFFFVKKKTRLTSLSRFASSFLPFYSNSPVILV